MTCWHLALIAMARASWAPSDLGGASMGILSVGTCDARCYRYMLMEMNEKTTPFGPFPECQQHKANGSTAMNCGPRSAKCEVS